MSVQVSAAAAPCPTHISNDVNRRSANYHPNIWGDYFLSHHSDFDVMDTNDIIEHQKFKEQVRSMLMVNSDKESQTLELIDAIQRLGISYHFETEIDEILKKMDKLNDHNDGLHDISLKFRLVRQQGYDMSSGVFNKFKDSQGNFKDSLVNDPQGLLSLYEASHLRVHGEDILDEALAFTTAHLQSMATQLSFPLDAQISRALIRPIRKGLPRLEARSYFSIYEGNASCNKVLLSFAKLDFNILQRQHKKELNIISKWWKELDVANSLPFARDRLVEGYFWTLSAYYEPQYVLGRQMLTKVFAVTTIIDDIYDVYGTPQELELFAAATDRWDNDAEHQLPDYMKVCYRALLNVYSEIEENMANQGTSYRLYYAKETMKNLVQAYLLESKWFHQKYTPTMEEYMPLALATSGYKMIIATAFLGMGHIVTEDSFKWLFSDPKMLTASQIICRLMDDVVSHEFEQKRGHVASGIECYIKQHGATEEEAIQVFQKQIVNAWKDVNEECMHPISVSMPILMRILNLVRILDVIYKYEDGYTHSQVVLKDFISSLLVDPATNVTRN